MDPTPGRRERKKERTRRAIADAALRQFAERGFDATTVESISEEADVAVSTFYAHFRGKEAPAFADADVRFALVERVLGDRPATQALHRTLRRAAHAIVEEDSRHRDAVAGRLQLVAREPKLTAYATRLQESYVERLTVLLADSLRIDRGRDPRPRVIAGAVFGALNAVWATWAADQSSDLHHLVDQAHDTLDAGFEAALADTSPRHIVP